MRRFLLLSDIHACDVDPSSASAPSYVSSYNASGSAKHDPISDLKRIIDELDDERPDYILCAGDITNRSSPSSFNYAWSKLSNLAEQVGAELVATVGNHDLDSRYLANKFDPRGYAMSLSPSIPADDRQSFLEYWAQNFTILQRDGCRILVLNTAAFHGGGVNPTAEIEHGRISEITVQRIASELETSQTAEINILLCHHHPIRSEPSDTELEGLTKGGEKLIELLGQSDVSWIVVHGHKHVPDLFYGHGGSNSPVVLSCASFSAQVNADAQNKNPNQVHLLTCDPVSATAAGWASSGYVRSWTWQAGPGWSPAHGVHGLPHLAGFGFRGAVRQLVDDIEKVLDTRGIGSMSWADATGAIPALERLIPRDFDQLERVAASRQIQFLSLRSGAKAQVGRTS